MTATYCKRLIEVDLPIKRISAHARREKSIRHGHISTLHIWWARRPLAACRAVICASLWPDPADPLCPKVFVAHAEALLRKRQRDVGGKIWRWQEPAQLREALLDFIADFANWDNSNDKGYLETARSLTQAAHEAMGGEKGTRPLVVDPFAGGGAIPLEALRVGADTFASDLNPLPVLLNTMALRFIPQFGQRLAIAAAKWGEEVRRRLHERLAPVYRGATAGELPITYIWARTILCEGPGCGVRLPLYRSPILAKRPGRYVWLAVAPTSSANAIEFELVEHDKAPTPQVALGTMRKGAALCPVCGYTNSGERVRSQLAQQRGGAATATLLAVASVHTGETGRKYRLPQTIDHDAVRRARDQLAELLVRQPDAIPSELVPPERPSPNARGLSAVTRIGVKTFGDLYSPRQQLALATLAEIILEIEAEISRSDPELARAVATLMSFARDKMADIGNSFARWEPIAQCPRQLFARQAAAIVWDFAESVPVSSSSGSWSTCVDGIVSAIETIGSNWAVGEVAQANAAEHPLPDGVAAAFITDPPYYDAIPYADLSDFFYVWLRRSLSTAFPQLMAPAMVPKDEEAIWNPSRTYTKTGKKKDEAFYENQMGRALREGLRITNAHGIGTVVFAHKTTAGWEAILGALIDAGWTATASWPIDTENASRTNAQGTASLASSVHIVCRPRLGHEVGNWRDVLRELPIRIHEWMPRLAAEGVVGADAIFACLGPALEVFSRFERVEKVSGEVVPLREYLEHVWAAVSREALAMIFHDPETSGLGEDARLTAMWLWTLAGPSSDHAANDHGEDEPEDDEDEDGGKKKAKSVGGFILEFDAARKIAQGLGCKLDALPHLIEVKGDKARLLPVSERARHLFGKDTHNQLAAPKPAKKKQLGLVFGDPEEEIASAGWGDLQAPSAGITTLDRIHQAMLLFAAGRSEGLKRFLVDDGAGQESQFWKLAQALSALYPGGTDEKRWVDGVLARKKGLGY